MLILRILPVLLLFFISCSTVEFISVETLPPTAYSPANASNRQKTIAFLLHTISNGRIIAGQNIGHADGSLNYYFIEGLFTNTGRKPGLLGVDLGYDNYTRDYTALIDYIAAHHAAGGLVTLSFHAPNPCNGGDVKDLTPFDYSLISTPGNRVYSNWMSILNNVGNFLQRMKDRGIIVLMRPFHEMNGGWFWWCNENAWMTREQFAACWRQMHDYFSIARRLDNLVWVYSPNYRYSEIQKDTDYYYPGADAVDIVAMDYYADTLSGIDSYSSVTRLRSLGKSFALGEVGPGDIDDGTFDARTWLGLTNHGAAYFLAWHSWQYAKKALVDCRGATELMASGGIVTLDEMEY